MISSLQQNLNWIWCLWIFLLSKFGYYTSCWRGVIAFFFQGHVTLRWCYCQYPTIQIGMTLTGVSYINLCPNLGDYSLCEVIPFTKVTWSFANDIMTIFKFIPLCTWSLKPLVSIYTFCQKGFICFLKSTSSYSNDIMTSSLNLKLVWV